MLKDCCYINGIGSVSIQTSAFDMFKDYPVPLQRNNKPVHPSYKEIIPPAMLRRMAPGIKMGIFAALEALRDAEINEPDGIITGTGMGCLLDSEKFLEAMIENKEQHLTPTYFIHSPHNTVAAQIALYLQCKAYNMTYSHGVSSFEAALLDSWLQIQNQFANYILVGGVDESAPIFDALCVLGKTFKNPNDSIDFHNPISDISCRAEGANFFVLSSNKKQSSYARLTDISIYHNPEDDFQKMLDEILTRNQITRKEIDIVFLGYNADVLQQKYFDNYASLFSNTALAFYQHICGSFDTASAYGFRIAAEILRKQIYPQSIRYNDVCPKKIQNVLLINQANGYNHSLVLLQSC